MFVISKWICVFKYVCATYEHTIYDASFVPNALYALCSSMQR